MRDEENQADPEVQYIQRKNTDILEKLVYNIITTIMNTVLFNKVSKHNARIMKKIKRN